MFNFDGSDRSFVQRSLKKYKQPNRHPQSIILCFEVYAGFVRSCVWTNLHPAVMDKKQFQYFTSRLFVSVVTLWQLEI